MSRMVIIRVMSSFTSTERAPTEEAVIIRGNICTRVDAGLIA
jgi:hypothetical protein